jgi:DNA helicase-2/ATP-dependent DNA helicase PcrA
MSTEKLLIKLNDSQRLAVTTIDGPLLILAGPGSGKTRVITHRIAYMVRQGVSPSEILGLTFTNKAAGEMRHRLVQLVGGGQVWLGTFHGFCVRLLRRYARLVGLPENFTIYDVDDASACLKQAVADAKFDLTHTSLGHLAQGIGFYKNRLITPDVLESEALSSSEYQVAQVYPFYQRSLLRNGAVDFDDILMHTALLLRQHPELREQLDRRFRYVLVDEYQDTNLAQYVILRHLSVDSPNLAATGDPDQSIYGWRGASLKNISNLERDYSDLKIIRLEENYRSTPEILSIADCLIRNNEYRKHKQLVPLRSTGHVVRLVVYPTARAEAEDVADQIATLIQQGTQQASDFGILYRTNAQSRLVEQAMLRRQIPYQLIGGFRFYLRKEIKDLLGYLQLVFNPDDDVAAQRIVNLPPRGIGKQTLLKLSQLAIARRLSLLESCRAAVAENWGSKKSTTGLREFLRIYDQLVRLSTGSLQELLQSVLELTDYREFLSKQRSDIENPGELFQNIDELLAEAQEVDAQVHDDRPALERFLESVALQSDTDQIESNGAKVTLMTLHAAKGLEFPSVYLIAVEENILPHSRCKSDPSQLEEERRLLFVGITRARDRLQLSYAKSRGFAGSQGAGVPSSFLMELPRHEVQVVDRCESDIFDGDQDRDDLSEYFHDDSGDFDQADQDPSDQTDGVEYDDHCQLPPEELKRRRLNKVQRHSGGQLTTGAKLAAASARWGRFRPGVQVMHPRWGVGQIVTATGHGPKRSVTVLFSDSQTDRTFRLSHAELEFVSE